MKNTPVLFAVMALCTVLALPAFAARDEEAEGCSEDGEAAKQSCIQTKCSRLARGSTAQLNCEEDCEAIGARVEQRCLNSKK